MNENTSRDFAQSNPIPGAYDVDGICDAYKISRSQFYLELKAGRIRAFKVGKRTLVSYEAAQEWQRQLEAEGYRASKAPTATKSD